MEIALVGFFDVAERVAGGAEGAGGGKYPAEVQHPVGLQNPGLRGVSMPPSPVRNRLVAAVSDSPPLLAVFLASPQMRSGTRSVCSSRRASSRDLLSHVGDRRIAHSPPNFRQSATLLAVRLRTRTKGPRAAFLPRMRRSPRGRNASFSIVFDHVTRSRHAFRRIGRVSAAGRPRH